MAISQNAVLWAVFVVVVLAALMADLVFFNRRAHEIKMREALLMSAFWIGLALAFNALLFFTRGPTIALEFFTGYVVEESLSVDNLFVFLMLFSYFRVPRESRHKVLFWGIMGVVVMRGIFIFAGIALIERLHWIVYIFGLILVVTGAKLAFGGDREVHPEKNPVVRIFRKFFPVTQDYHGGKFFVREEVSPATQNAPSEGSLACKAGRAGRLMATPLFIVLLVVETTDVLFAVDSIPAVFAITLDRLVVYSSNIFAVLGLRSLFFVIAGFLELFRFLNYGLAVILVFVGAKMLVSDFFRIPIAVALGVIAGILAISILASVLIPKKPCADGIVKGS